MPRSRTVLPTVLVTGVLLSAWAARGLAWQAPAGTAAAPAMLKSGATRVGTVDLVRVFNELDQIKDLNAQFRQTRERLAEEAAARRKALDELATKVRAYKPDSPDLPAIKKQFTDQTIQFKAWLESTEQSLKSDEFTWMSRLYEVVTATISDVARANGFDVIVTSEPFDPSAAQDDVQNLQSLIRARKVVFSVPETDITATVVEQLNRQYRAKPGGGGAPKPPAP